MDFFTAVKTCFRKYATFKGRAARSEYWYFTLFNLIVVMALSILDQAVFATPIDSGSEGVFSAIYSLLVLLPAWGVGVRRLHDLGRSGWWYLVLFIPLIGLILVIYWMCKAGMPEANEYGLNPLFKENASDSKADLKDF